MISIIMPLYNGMEFLPDSISSIINQTFKEWELIIGVNGEHSEEDFEKLASIIKEFNHDNIHVVLYPWKSKIKTLNEMAKLAQYDIICLIDVDDYWLPEKLRKQMRFIGSYDVVGSDACYFGDKLGTPKLFLGALNPLMFMFQNPVINSTAMLKKRDAHWDEEWEGLDDYNLWVHIMEQGKRFYNVPEVLINHRIHNKSFYNYSNEEQAGKLTKLLSKWEPLDESTILVLSKVIAEAKWIL